MQGFLFQYGGVLTDVRCAEAELCLIFSSPSFPVASVVIPLVFLSRTY